MGFEELVAKIQELTGMDGVTAVRLVASTMTKLMGNSTLGTLADWVPEELAQALIEFARQASTQMLEDLYAN